MTGLEKDHFLILVALDVSRTVAASTPHPEALIMPQKLAVSAEDAEAMEMGRPKSETLVIGIERGLLRLLYRVHRRQETSIAPSAVTDH